MSALGKDDELQRTTTNVDDPRLQAAIAALMAAGAQERAVVALLHVATALVTLRDAANFAASVMNTAAAKALLEQLRGVDRSLQSVALALGFDKAHLGLSLDSLIDVVLDDAEAAHQRATKGLN